MRPTGEAEMQNKLAPHPHMLAEQPGEMVAAEFPLRKRGALAPNMGSQPKVPIPGRGVPTKSDCKNQ